MNKPREASATVDSRSVDYSGNPRGSSIARLGFTDIHVFITRLVTPAYELPAVSLSHVPTELYLSLRSQGASGVPEISMPEGQKIDCDQEAWHFAQSKGLIRGILTYTALALKTFQTVNSPSCHFKHDPENEEVYLTIRLEVKGELESVLNAEDTFRSQAIDLISVDELYLLRLSCVIG